MNLISLLAFIIISPIRGENHKLFGPGRVSGAVIESMSEQPIEYANVVIYDLKQRQITGTATDDKGHFLIPGLEFGDYIIEISFIGFKTEIDTIKITSQNYEINLGVIKLEQKPIIIEGVEVNAEKMPLEFKIDKKVINVKEHYKGQSGTAVDVLQNLPAISVDIEGNVTLRGSSNFQVLIDNRPTILAPREALQQIPVSIIDRIEIITNPSARYDPEGIAGIINVITRKITQGGINGIANLNLGLDEKYAGDFLINYRHKRIRTFLGLDYNNFNFQGSNLEERETKIGDTTFYSYMRGNNSWLRKFYGLKTGLEYTINPQSRGSLSFEFRSRGMENSLDAQYQKWTDLGDSVVYYSASNPSRGGFFYNLNADYTRNFSKEHKLSARLSLNRFDGNDKSTSELKVSESVISSGFKTEEKGPGYMFSLNLDYTLPFKEKRKLELGYQTTMNHTDGIQDVYLYDTTTTNYKFVPEYSHRAKFINDNHSLYGTYSDELGNFGFKSGLRGVYTYRFVQLDDTQKVELKRFDLFPTLHLSYKLPPVDQIMMSYTRRVRFPRNWDLEPFEMWRNPYSVHKGNPALLPEFVDAFELGYQRQWERSLFSLDFYYRITHNRIEHTTKIYEGETMLFTVENIGNDYAYGLEPSFNISILKWFNTNLSANIYEHRTEGIIDGREYSQKNRTWGMRNMSTLKITNSTRLQITCIYRGPDITGQEERKAFLSIDLGLRQELLKGVLSINIQGRDILNTAKFENTTNGENFYVHREFDRKSPIILLGINYNFNNYRQEKKQQEFEEEIEEVEYY